MVGNVIQGRVSIYSCRLILPMGICILACRHFDINIVPNRHAIYIYLTILVRQLEYSGITKPIQWLLMPWLIALPCHRNPWYGLYGITLSTSSPSYSFKTLCLMSVAKWWKTEICCHVSRSKFSSVRASSLNHGFRISGTMYVCIWKCSPIGLFLLRIFFKNIELNMLSRDSFLSLCEFHILSYDILQSTGFATGCVSVNLTQRKSFCVFVSIYISMHIFWYWIIYLYLMLYCLIYTSQIAFYLVKYPCIVFFVS